MKDQSLEKLVVRAEVVRQLGEPCTMESLSKEASSRRTGLESKQQKDAGKIHTDIHRRLPSNIKRPR